MTFLKELSKIKFLLLSQIFILAFSAYFDFIPFYFLSGLVFLALLSYYTFLKPYLFVIVILVGMIIDSFLPIKIRANSPSLLVSELFLLSLTPIIFIRFFLDYYNREKIPNEILIWFPFLIWSLLIGLIIGIDKLRIIAFWKNYFAGFLTLFVVMNFLVEDKEVKLLLRSIIFWAVGLALLEIKVILDAGGLVSGFVGLFIYKNLMNIGWGRSNYLAAFFVVIIPITLGYLLYTKKVFEKYLLSFFLLIMFFAITLTLSRGGILALIVALIILLPKVVKPRYFFSALLLLAAIIVIFLLNPLTFVIIDRLSTLETSGSVYSRINYYIDVWNAFLDYPFTGVGFGNLSYYSKFILGPEFSPSAHNIVLGALGELGLFGAIMYLSIFLLIGKKIYLFYKSENDDYIKILRWSFIASFIGGFVHSLVEPTLEGFQFSIVFWSITSLNFKLHLFKK